MSHETFEELAALNAIGAATAAEDEALRRHLESCASCAAVAREYVEAAALMATSLDPIEPPAALRDQIRAATLTRSAQPEIELGETTARRRRQRPQWWLATAATFFLALWGWSELRVRTARTQIDELQARGKFLEESNRRLQREKENLAGTLGTIAAPDTRMIALSGQEVAPSASARVFLDPARRRAFVFFHNLPPNSGDKSYELWIIRADMAAPQPAGVFDVGEDGEAQLSVENLPVGVELKALAVTLEPRGGVAAPTGKMYLVGSSS